MESHHIALLTLACEAHDRATTTRELIDKEGIVTTDRFGQRITHPAVAVERDSRAAYARLVKQLDLDLVPAGPVGRPRARDERLASNATAEANLPGSATGPGYFRPCRPCQG